MNCQRQDVAHRTPQSRQVRVTGVVEMIRHSTRSFRLKLEDGTEIRGVLKTREQTEELKQFLGKKLLVFGRAVYRVSGKLLRIDAQGFETGERQPRLFARVPTAREIRPAIVRIKPASHQQQGVSAFFGTWPGEETDEDFERMLAELRGRRTGKSACATSSTATPGCERKIAQAGVPVSQPHGKT